MLMTAEKLILLRLYNLIFGRFDLGGKLLRKILETVLIKRKTCPDRYVPCSKYFDCNYFKKNDK